MDLCSVIVDPATDEAVTPSASPRDRPAPERLVNLTPHDIVVQAAELPHEGDDLDQVGLTELRIAAQGSFARVDDDAARLRRSWLNAGSALIPLTRLRRSSKLIDLPPPEPGTRLVVSRLTALAARHRSDLVFPLDEIRDPAGQIVGVRGLGTFRPAITLGKRPWTWRAAAKSHLARRPLGQEWLTGLCFASGTALLSGFLALIPGAVDNGFSHGWAGTWRSWSWWTSVFCLLAGGVLLGIGTWRWRRRGTILGERGTAYVLDEVAVPWQHEEKESALTDIRAGFARTLLVPGPDALGDVWQWRTDAASAPLWDEKVDTLVRSFWTVHYNDDQITRNALFTWAPWPVAVAFGARATARRRGLVLNVRQRPSYGAAGPRHKLDLTDRPHDFLRTTRHDPLERTAPDHRVTHLDGELTLTFKPLIREKDHRPGSPVPRPARQQSRSGRPGSAPVLFLLVRTILEKIDTIPLDLAEVPPVVCHATSHLIESALPAGTHQVPVAEWRLESAIDPVPQLPWEAFPAAAEQIATWVAAQAAARPDHVVLLAARVPQELAVGLGVQLGQRTREWPRRVYPVYYQRGGLVVPELRLGAESIAGERS